MATAARSETSALLWVVGGLALAWNVLGASDYTMTQYGGAEYLRSAGMDAASIAYMQEVPAWAEAGWALGVWGGVAGAVLLLLRRRAAVWAFAVSLIGLAMMTAYTYSRDLPPGLSSPGAIAFDWSIKLVAVLLLWYAWRLRQRGVLR